MDGEDAGLRVRHVERSQAGRRSGVDVAASDARKFNRSAGTIAFLIEHSGVSHHVAMSWLSFDEQVEKLTRAGLQVSDKAELHRFLSRVNYFRFLPFFWRPF